jgi:hypothetical protein
MVAAENSEIKDKAKLREHLYKNPTKLAIKLQKFLQSEDGELLPSVKIKGKGYKYLYSYYDKKNILCPCNGEYYLMPWVDEDPSVCYLYSHYKWMIGVVLKIKRDKIELIGFN